MLVIAGGGVWLIVLIGLFVIRRPRASVDATDSVPIATREGRLQVLLQRAKTGTATPAEQAELERAHLVYWIRRLDLRGKTPAAAYATIRNHEQGGPMVRQMEDWLHVPHRRDPVNPSEFFSQCRALLAELERASGK